MKTELLERVLERLTLPRFPEPDADGLRMLYAAWCQRVPFDNIRKLMHLREGSPGPLPGANAEDFLEAWLKHGTGGTCWAGAGALHAVLDALGFAVERGVATMLVAPNLPPNHGTVLVSLGGKRYLVDTSILHAEPLPLVGDAETTITHGAWGVRSRWREGRVHIGWRPLHKVDGFECRLDSTGADAEDFGRSYERTRGWSPFNYELAARVNRGEEVVGFGFGQAVTLHADGTVSRFPVTMEERNRRLIEDLGISEEMAARLPADLPTPPPPWGNGGASRAGSG